MASPILPCLTGGEEMPDKATGGAEQTLKGDALPGHSTQSITPCSEKR